MPTKTKTLADLAAEAAEIERQKAAIQLPVLQAITQKLSAPAIPELVNDLKAAQAEVMGEHADQIGYLITTLTNVPQHLASVVTMLDAMVNPPVMPTPAQEPAPAA